MSTDDIHISKESESNMSEYGMYQRIPKTWVLIRKEFNIL